MITTLGFERLVGTEIGAVTAGPDGTTIFLHGTDGSTYQVASILSSDDGFTTYPVCRQTCLPDPNYD